MPIAVFRRTIEKQVDKDVSALKELTSSPPAIQVQEETPAGWPPTLAAILGSEPLLSVETAHVPLMLAT